MLAEPPSGRSDPTRLAHHAEAAADSEAVLRYAPAAAELATSSGRPPRGGRAVRARASVRRRPSARAPRRAARAALFRVFLDRSVRGGARGAGRRRSRATGALATAARKGTRSAPSRACSATSAASRRRDAGRAAVEVLESLPPGRELALAYCNLSYLFESCGGRRGHAGLGHPGARARASASTTSEPLVYALINIGAMELLAGDPAGRRSSRGASSLRKGQSSKS